MGFLILFRAIPFWQVTEGFIFQPLNLLEEVWLRNLRRQIFREPTNIFLPSCMTLPAQPLLLFRKRINTGAAIKVSLESNSLFNVQQKSLWGTRFDYNAGRNLKLGGTFLRFNERPLTQKVGIGDEPVSNIVAGLDFTYKTETPFITRL